MRTTRGSRSRRLLGRPASVASGWARSSEAPSGLRRIEAPIDSRLVQRRLGQERATDRRDDRSRSLTLSLIEDPTSPAEAWRGARAARLALQLKLSLPRLISSPASKGSIDGLRAFSRNSGRRARPTSLLPSFTPKGLGRVFYRDFLPLAADESTQRLQGFAGKSVDAREAIIRERRRDDPVFDGYRI
jgi:hypothetical protein